MYLLGALDILGVILFLVPALALCCTIKCCNKKS
jgi:TRAP-type mannitol/chloroaromatic compound transport system permease small subunit